MPNDELVLISYNVHAGFDTDGNPAPAAAPGVLVEESWDVVMLQELDRHTKRNSGYDLVSLWAIVLDCAPLFCSAMEFDGGLYGIGALLKVPVRNVQRLDLTVEGGFEPRVAMAVELANPAGIWLINTHLGLEVQERAQQTERLAEFIKGLKGYKILCGDFNFASDTEATPFVNAGLKELDTPPTYPSANPQSRLDRFFYSDGIEPLGVRVIDTVLSRKASDHLPLVARFKVVPK